MSIINKLARAQGRRDEVPDQELAAELVKKRDRAGIREIADNLGNRDKKIQNDCIKVLYEVGYLAPELIADYYDNFLRLLHGRNNRLVWGGMIALSTVAPLKAKELYEHSREIERVMDTGSVITVDAGVRVLAAIVAGNEKRSKDVFQYLLDHLALCRPKEVPQHAESTLVAVSKANKKKFISVLQKRLEDLSAPQASRVKRVLKQVE
jgi:hypothetical protein